jgi:hypothetical protein
MFEKKERNDDVKKFKFSNSKGYDIKMYNFKR